MKYKPTKSFHGGLSSTEENKLLFFFLLRLTYPAYAHITVFYIA